MDWKEVGVAVAQSAPALGVALGGPAGGAIGGLIAAAFGTDNSPDSVAQAVANDPEAAVKLRELELHHAEVLAGLAADQYKAALLDTQQARTTHQGHWMPAALTIALAAMVTGMVGALMLVDTPASNESVIYLISGQLIGAFATAVAYWLGSSRGSADKQRVLEERR